MSQTREIKNRIASVKKTQQITRAMKMIASVKYKKLEKLLFSSRPYFDFLNKIVKGIAHRNNALFDPLYQKEKTNNKRLLLVVLGDRGLCGNYNSAILKEALNFVKQDNNTDIFLIGKKGKKFFEKRNITLVKQYNNNSREFSFDFFAEIASELIKIYSSYDNIHMLSTQFKSTIKRELCLKQILPIKEEAKEEKEKLIVDYLYELEEDVVVHDAAVEYINSLIRVGLYEAVVSEESSRMTSMESATSNADDMIRLLTLEYNRARQAGITTELLEVANGAEALNQ